MKAILNLILILLFGYSVYLIWKIPQPYGIISLVILSITFLFNFLKSRKVSVPLYILGIGGSVFVLIAAYNFTSYIEEQRDRFNIPTAVKFEKEDFNSVLVKAKTENKLIFIDFYTGWCGPCLKFTQTVLTDDEVGKYMNSTFINLKYDAEKGEGITLAKKYNVKSYPTLLILDHEGNVVEDVMVKQLAVKEDMIRLSMKYKTTLDKKN